MKRIAFFIDGFNVYHALNNNKYRKYLWLDYSALAKCFVSPKDQIVDIFYFTAFARWNPDKVRRHKMLVQAWKKKGIKPVFGKFKLVDKKCRGTCKEWYKTYEEKQTDVNIAIKLFQTAVRDEFDTAILISGDTDLVPAISAIKETFPKKEVVAVIPIGRRAKDLEKVCDSRMKMKERHLQSSQFPDKVVLDQAKGIVFERPPAWK